MIPISQMLYMAEAEGVTPICYTRTARLNATVNDVCMYCYHPTTDDIAEYAAKNGLPDLTDKDWEYLIYKLRI